MNPSESARVVALALAITLGGQTLAAFGVHSPAVFGPVAVRDLGIGADKVGLFVTLSYGAAMLVGLASPSVISRYGPLRTVQLSIVLVALGLAVGAIGALPAVIAAALISGFGNGLIGPVSAQILAERAPPRLMSLIFSIKQTGVPLGGALAGAILPFAVLSIGWQRSLVIVAILYALIALALQPLRAGYDARRDPSTPINLRTALAQMKRSIVFTVSNPRLRDLAIVGCAYVAAQLVVMTYAVSYFNLELGYSLVAAGFIFSMTQITGIVGRIFWGAIGDRMRSQLPLLGWLGIAGGAAAGLLAFSTPAWSPTMVLAAGAFFGATGIAWNGVYFSEVARSVPREEVSRAASGGLFFSFLGGISGPLLFTLLVPAGRSYALGFAAVAVISTLAGLRLLLQSEPNEPK